MTDIMEIRADVDLVPGTEVMTDVLGATLHHSSNEQSATVLIPQPTDDPSDPLVR